MKFAKNMIVAAGLVAAMASATAAPISLDFEGIASQASINNFYNGGTDSAGNSGVNYGVQFNSNALALTETDPAANIGNLPSGITGMIFLTGTAILNYAPGFDTGFSFYYSTVSFTGSVNVYDGLNGTGTLLGTIDLPALGTGPSPGNPFSNWEIGSVSFSGVAKSINFGGTVNQVVYDDITFGSVTPGVPAVPEPSTYAMLALGLAGVGLVARRRKTVD